ncbi:MAG: hypothetical protein FWG90_04905 [Oscillospiraceae bacterium]|nr:hypothetical protein [Oscillospiraceae bacterium]
MDMAIQKASDKMAFLQNDKEILREYRMREMALSDYNSGMAKARKEGILQVAKNMLLKGFAPEMVTEITNLPLEQVQQL